jgi:hypothetical protein
MEKTYKKISLEVEVLEDEDGKFYLSPPKFFNAGFIAEGNTLEEAETHFWNWFEYCSDFDKLDLIKYNRFAFEKGDWSRIGGSWITIFGLNFYFRYGEGMKGGKYIPFTKLNVSFINLWDEYKKKKKELNNKKYKLF